MGDWCIPLLQRSSTVFGTYPSSAPVLPLLGSGSASGSGEGSVWGSDDPEEEVDPESWAEMTPRSP